MLRKVSVDFSICHLLGSSQDFLALRVTFPLSSWALSGIYGALVGIFAFVLLCETGWLLIWASTDINPSTYFPQPIFFPVT